jgi:hypothetical protein
MPSNRIAVVIMCASGLLSGCAFQKYRPAPLSPRQTAAALQSRTLTAPGLREFMQETAGKGATAWPIEQWDLADLTLAAFYYNPPPLPRTPGGRGLRLCGGLHGQYEDEERGR